MVEIKRVAGLPDSYTIFANVFIFKFVVFRNSEIIFHRLLVWESNQNEF